MKRWLRLPNWVVTLSMVVQLAIGITAVLILKWWIERPKKK